MNGGDGSVRSAAAAGSEAGNREARLKSSDKTQVRALDRLERRWLSDPRPAAGTCAGGRRTACTTWPHALADTHCSALPHRLPTCRPMRY